MQKNSLFFLVFCILHYDSIELFLVKICFLGGRVQPTLGVRGLKIPQIVISRSPATPADTVGVVLALSALALDRQMIHGKLVTLPAKYLRQGFFVNVTYRVNVWGDARANFNRAVCTNIEVGLASYRAALGSAHL